MENKKNKYIFYLAIFFTITLAGCANTVKFRYESKPNETMIEGPRTTIAGLVENWTDYDIYYSGLRTTLAKGILFDPKNDNRVLRPEGADWVKVDDEETFRDLIHWQANPREIDGRLFRILSPDDQFFGYAYLYRYYYSAAAKMVDENTIVVYPISVPVPVMGVTYN